jgi:lysine-N-methylase
MTNRPDYYDEFKCIAGDCKHNCCIGWEIDVDSDSLAKYNNKEWALKEKLKNNISLEPCAHFILAENERCPFLNSDNLCEIILSGGEDMLCQICKDHPRFYNDVYGITEKGIGLACEAAAKIILTKTEPMRLISEGSETISNAFFESRNEIVKILQNREKPLKKRINELLDLAKLSSPVGEKDWVSIFKGLERLDPEWDNYLDLISYVEEEIPYGLETHYEQLICYFIYRHLCGALEDNMFSERILFSILSCYFIASINKSGSIDEMIEIARMYSSEIEYSDENVFNLLEALQSAT